MESYNEVRFETQVSKALQRIRTLLHNSRNPQYPADVFHQYDDKFLLVDFLTNSVLAGQMNCLQELGVVDWDALKKWSENRSVTLRFRVQEHCEFVKKKKRKEESPTLVTETKIGGIPIPFSSKEKIVSTFTDYIWKLSVEYEIFAFQGNNPDEKIVLKARTGSMKLTTSYEAMPKPKDSDIITHDVNLTWLLQNLSTNKDLCFSIKRSDKKCHTPRRNADIDKALSFFANFYVWSENICDYFRNTLFPLQENHGLDLDKMNDEGIFVPVVPLYDEAAINQISKSAKIPPPALPEPDPKESKKKDEGEIVPVEPPSPIIVLPSPTRSATSPVLMIEDLNAFLEEQTKSFTEKRADFEKLFPEDKKGENMITFNEATIIAALSNSMSIAQSYADGVDYVEEMMRKQLIAAIGQEVSPADFANYMKYHNKKIFKDKFQPRPFSYAVRQPDHYPEGTLGIDLKLDDGSISEPINTIVSKREAVSHPMKFGINASTQVPFYGDRYLHAFVAQEFSGASGTSIELIARARQFSCFILMVGRLQTSEIFDPKYAIIVQNKDELKIPLSLEQIPSPQEFRDAIESLSPEQQNFAKAIRSMQLASTLFAICVLEIKPQAEKLLKLPSDSLIKEIELTQDLLELFMKYQIPSDMLTYDGKSDASTPMKVQTVKSYSQKLKGMIATQKQAEIDEAKKKAEMERLQREREEKKRLHQLRKQQRAETRKRRAEEKARKMQAVELEGAIHVRGRKNESWMREECKEKSYSKDKKKSAAPMKSRAMHAKSKPAARSMAPSPMMNAKPSAPPSFGGGGAPPPSPSLPLSGLVVPAADGIAPPSPAPSPAVEAPQAQPDTAVSPDAAPDTGKELVERAVDLDGYISGEDDTEIDYTKIPEELDSKFDELDLDNALRPTIINVENTWHKKYQRDLLSPPLETSIDTAQLEKERTKAFDLIDILSKSGNLAWNQAQLHIVIAATHCFDKTLTNTVIQDNVNPIEKLERSNLIVATTIHRQPAAELVKLEHLDSVKTYSQGVFIATEEQ